MNPLKWIVSALIGIVLGAMLGALYLLYVVGVESREAKEKKDAATQGEGK